MADCMQFLLENHLNGCQIFGRFGFLETESEQISVFTHIPNERYVDVLCVSQNTIRWQDLEYLTRSLTSRSDSRLMLSSILVHAVSVNSSVTRLSQKSTKLSPQSLGQI